VGKTGNMRRRARVDEPVASIAHHVGVSEPTAGSAKMVGLSPELPRRRQPNSDVLAPYEATTVPLPDDDCRNWRTEQRHTAARACAGLWG
jgi:hypothetical protein